MPLISHPGSSYHIVGGLGGGGDDSNGNYKHFRVCDRLSQILLGLMRSFSKSGTDEMLKCISFTYMCSGPGIIFFKFLHISLILLETGRGSRTFPELHF